jgi:hypothetical protein
VREIKSALLAVLSQSKFSRNMKPMEVHLTPEQEAQLAQIATKTGTDPERLVKDVVLRLLESEAPTPGDAPELPLWHLGVKGPLHRRDLYSDVR